MFKSHSDKPKPVPDSQNKEEQLARCKKDLKELMEKYNPKISKIWDLGAEKVKLEKEAKNNPSNILTKQIYDISNQIEILNKEIAESKEAETIENLQEVIEELEGELGQTSGNSIYPS